MEKVHICCIFEVKKATCHYQVEFNINIKVATQDGIITENSANAEKH